MRLKTKSSIINLAMCLVDTVVTRFYKMIGEKR